MTTHQALVLNADFRPLSYFPLSLLGWQDAVRLIFQDKLVIVAEYERIIRSPSRAMRLPSVVALRAFVPMPRRVAFTRFNVFLRDHFRCQYCGAEFSSKDLTFDHVVPRSRGGETRWDNVLAACEPCNTRKGSRADVHPLRAPRQPTAHELLAAKRCYPPSYLHESWLDYLYWDAELAT
jgi:5-methylcytosine-specific restriction endonuclease McrA